VWVKPKLSARVVANLKKELAVANRLDEFPLPPV
jgi:hypothetical protein